MSEVAFHTGIPDKIGYACRLLRKAWRQRQPVVVTGDAATLARLDAALWTFEPQAFIPHLRIGAGTAIPPPLARTPIWLVEPGAEAPHRGVLVNLGPAPAPQPQAYARVLELVDDSEPDRQAGRQRWNGYRAAGWTVTHHPQAAA